MSSLPTPLRAVLGVALTVVDTARETTTHLPQKAAGLPVAVVSQAVQLSLRAQQQYAVYVNKGDELIGTFRGAPEEPPAWATFDEDEPTPARNTAFDRVPDAEDELDELQALEELEDLAEVLADEPVTTRLDAALDVLDGSYEAADGPKPTPGAPATTGSDAEITLDAVGDEIIGADAPRSTVSREPARKATRKIATKASRKTAAKKAPAKKAAPATETLPSTSVAKTGGLPSSAPTAAKKAAKAARKAPATALPGAGSDLPPAKRAAKKAARKAPATKAAPPVDVPATTLEGDPLPEPTLPLTIVPDTDTGTATPPADGTGR